MSLLLKKSENQKEFKLLYIEKQEVSLGKILFAVLKRNRVI